MTNVKIESMYLLFPLFSVVTAGSFKLSELQNVNYQLDISTMPAGFPSPKEISKFDANDEEKLKQLMGNIPDSSDSSYVIITSKSGQKFACNLPNIPEKKENAIPDSLNPKYVADIVAAAFYVKDCIQRNTGWWSYELCRGKTIKQFHGRKGKGEFVEYSLGMFTGKYSMPDYAQSTKERLLYLEEVYSGGSMCDVVGKQLPRKTSVRYECDSLLATNEAYIHNVHEEASCEYLITVKLGSICKLPQFVSPSSREEPLMIECRPFVEKEKAVMMALKLKEKERNKEEGVRILKEQTIYLDSIRRRRAAHKRTSLFTNYEENEKIKLRLAAEHKLANHWYMEALHLAKEGRLPDETKLDALQKIGKYVDDFELVLNEYDSAYDTDRGNFWYYMNDKKWPKDEYPRSLYYVDLLNAYYEETQRLALTAYSEEGAAEIRRKARKNPFKIENNVLVSEREILHQLDYYFPSWYARDDGNEMGYLKLIKSTLYHNEVVEAYIETLLAEFQQGTEIGVTKDDQLYEIGKNLAPLLVTIKILNNHRDNTDTMSHMVILMEKLVYATEYAQLSWEVRQPNHKLSFKEKYGQEEKKVAASGYWNEYYKHVLKMIPPETLLKERKEYEKVLTKLSSEVYLVAFEEVWQKKGEKMVQKRREKLEKRSPLLDILEGRGGMAVPFTLEDQQQMMDLIAQAGLGDLDVKIQVMNAEEILGADAQSPEMQELMNEVLDDTLEVFHQRQKTEKRERAYWSKVEDDL